MSRDGFAFNFRAVRTKTGFGILNPADGSSKITRSIVETHSVKFGRKESFII